MLSMREQIAVITMNEIFLPQAKRSSSHACGVTVLMPSAAKEGCFFEETIDSDLQKN